MHQTPKDASRSGARAESGNKTLPLSLAGSLLAASGGAFALGEPAQLESQDIQARIAVIRDRLRDPETAAGIAKRLRVDRDGEVLTFANFNNWDNGWDNQGFNNY